MAMKPLYAGLITAAAIVGAILICVGCRRCYRTRDYDDGKARRYIPGSKAASRRRLRGDGVVARVLRGDGVAARVVLSTPSRRRIDRRTARRHHGRGKRARRRTILPHTDVGPRR